MNVHEVIESYITRKRSAGLEWVFGQTILQRFAEFLCNPLVSEIRQADVAAFLNTVQKSTGRLNQVRCTLRDFFAYCFGMGLISSVPLSHIVVRQDPAFSPFIYSRQQIRALLRAVPRSQKDPQCIIGVQTLQALLLFLYGTGLIVGSALKLKTSDVDLSLNLVWVRRIHVGTMRWLPISESLSVVLGRYLANARSSNAASDLFFVTRTGEPIVLRTLDDCFSRVRKLANVARHDGAGRQPRIRDLQHTFAVHSIEDWQRNGADVNILLPILADYMGSLLVTKCDRYLRLTPSSFWSQLEKLSIESDNRPGKPIGGPGYLSLGGSPP